MMEHWTILTYCAKRSERILNKDPYFDILYQRGNSTMLRIAICDDDRSDRDRISGFVSEYLEEKELRAEVKVFDHPDKLIQE